MSQKVAVVTGCGGIIGPSIVEKLLEEGWTVAAVERTPEELENASRLYGREVGGHPFFADLSTRAACERLIGEIEATLGPVQALVNNAAINRNALFEDIDEADANLQWSVNVMAPAWLIHAAKPSLVAHKGAVVNMSSMQLVRPLKPSLLYNCTKAALETLTTQLAGLLLEDGVRFNAIRIGLIPGHAFLRPVAESLPPDEAKRMVEEVMPLHYANSRLRNGEHCVGSPTDVADLVAFLLRSRFVNGEVIMLDGGFSQRYVQYAVAQATSPNDLIRNWLEANGKSAL